MDFLDNYDTLLKTFWFTAIPASLIFIVQTIMTFVGADASEGLEADFDSNLDGGDAPFQLFSLRNLINFLLGFSWTGISLYNSVSNHTVLIGIAFIIGCAFVFLFFIIIKQLQKLSEDNSFNIQNTLGKTADVYLKIPANKSGKGKVLISIKGATHELMAMTEGEELPSNAVVKVAKIENNEIVIVEKI
ncbi:MAG: NfeD family protein [Bacteroidia bacterium]